LPTGFIGASIPGDDLADQFKRFGDKVVSEENPPDDTGWDKSPDSLEKLVAKRPASYLGAFTL